MINDQAQLWQHNRWYRAGGTSDTSVCDWILFLVNMYVFKFYSYGVRDMKQDTSSVLVWHAEIPDLELRVMGRLYNTQGPPTKWGTSIRFPTIKRADSQLFPHTSALLPSFSLRRVKPSLSTVQITKVLLVILPKEIFRRVKVSTSIGSFHLHFFLSSPQRFASCK